MTSARFGLLRPSAAAVLLAGVLILPDSANAGPPFHTDDPEPVDYGHSEFYTFVTGHM
jgi:hypothetical protein